MAETPLSNREPVAVVGIGGRFPNAADPRALWRLLREGQCATGPVPEGRDALAAWQDVWRIRAGFLTNIDRFDAPFFGIAPKDAGAMDPQQRLFLEVVWATLEDAGYQPANLPRRTGVFVGVISADYRTFAEPAALHGGVPLRGTDHYQVANRVSYHFDFQGPSLSIDTACSSSGVALHYAVQSLRLGESAAAVVGGVNLFLHASRFAQFRQMQIISEDNVCRPFRAGANGTVYGEGICAVLLKRLSDAERDGDDIRAVIRATAVNSGGHTPGFTVPSHAAQAALVETVLADAAVNAGSVGYVEAHGTGTALGDPIEVRGLTEAFRRRGGAEAGSAQCALGSIKGNIGHLESAAAIAGLIKIVLQIQHGEIAPSLPAGNSNPLIKFEKTPFRLQDALGPWPPAEGAPLRAMVSSFGAGGVNACALVERHEPAETGTVAAGPFLFPVSARTAEDLERFLKALAGWAAEAGSGVPADRVAWTLQVGRVGFRHRVAILAHDLSELAKAITLHFSKKASPRVFAGTLSTDVARTFAPAEEGGAVVRDLLARKAWRSLAALWVNGAEVEWADNSGQARPRRIGLPTYPFAGQRYWLAPARSDAAPPDAARPTAFLGERLVSAFQDGVVYRSRLDAQGTPWVSHHRLFGQIIVPGSFFVALAASAVAAERGGCGFVLEDLAFLDSLPITDAGGCVVECNLHSPAPDGRQQIEIASTAEGCKTSRIHFRGFLSAAPPVLPAWTPPDGGDGLSHQNPAQFYDLGGRLGFGWTGPFRAISALLVGAGYAEGRVGRDGSLGAAHPEDVIHPAQLDACFQICLAALAPSLTEAGEALMPFGIDRLTVHRPVTGDSRAISRIADATRPTSVRFDCAIADDGGCPALTVQGMTTLRVLRGEDRPAASKGRLPREESSGLSPSLAEMLHAPKWIPVPLPAGAPQPLCVMPCGSGAKTVAEALHGADAVTLVAGTLDAGQLSATLGGCGARRLDLLFSVAETPEETDAAALEAELEAEFAGLKRVLAKATELADACPVRLWIVTHDTAVIDGENAAPIGLKGRAMAGLGRSLAWEERAHWGGLIDVARCPQPADVALVRAWLALDPVEDHLAVRRGRGFTLRLCPDVCANPGPAGSGERQPITAQGRYLVTGGLGGLGRLHVEWLIAGGARQIEIASRRSLGATERAALEALGRDGTRITHHAVDVASRDAVMDLVAGLRAGDSPLRGVVHAAGTTDDGIFRNLDWPRVASVLATKLRGTLNLAEAFAGAELDFFAVTSTATALLGAPGQTNYTMANAAMDAVCDHLRRSGLPVFCVNWGPWRQTGMTARISPTSGGNSRITSGASAAIPPEAAGDLFGRLYGGSARQVAVLPAGWRQLVDGGPGTRLPSPWRSPDSVAAPALTRRAAAGRVLGADAETVLTHAVNEVLGYGDTVAFDWNSRFRDIGLDSLSAVTLRDRINDALGIRLNATAVFDYPTPTLLLGYIRSLLGDGQPAEDGAPETFRADERSVEALSEQEVDALIEAELEEFASELAVAT